MIFVVCALFAIPTTCFKLMPKMILDRRGFARRTLLCLLRYRAPTCQKYTYISLCLFSVHRRSLIHCLYWTITISVVHFLLSVYARFYARGTDYILQKFTCVIIVIVCTARPLSATDKCITSPFFLPERICRSSEYLRLIIRLTLKLSTCLYKRD